MSEKEKQPIRNTYCCENFKHFILHYKWFVLEDKIKHKNIFLIPYIQFGKNKMRINYCPSCGKKIRDIEIDEDEFKSLIKD
jgi:hypothetical protein